MGSLANCIKIHGISKEEAKLLRKTAMLYRQGGMKAKLANEQAVKDTLDDLTSERDSINRQIQDVLARRKPERAEFRQRIQGLIDTGQMTNEELKTIRNERLLEKLGVVSKEKPDRRVDLEKREEVKKWMRLENLSPEDEYTRERLKAVWEQIRTEKAGETKDISQVVGEVRKPAVDQKLLQKEIEPTTYVHETNATTFDKFDMAKIGTGQGDAWLGQGIYLQEKGSFKLETYGKNKIEASLAPDAKIFEVKNTPDGEYRDTFVEYAVNNGIGRAKELVDQRRKDGLSLKNLLPRDILRNNPEAVEQLKKAGFDGLLQDGELVVYNPDILKITTQKGAYPVKNKPISELIIDLNDAIGDKGAIGGEGGADVSKVVPILMDIGKTVYADGHQTYVAFKRQMQVTLGKTYQKVRDLILKVWEMVKRYAKEVQPGLSIRDVSKEGKAPIFFSQLQQLIEQKMPNKADVQTVRNIIRDAKQDEIKWSGIEDFLQGKDTVNKQELLDYLRANEIEIKEVTLSDKSQYSGRTPEDLLEEADEAERIAQKAQKQGDNEKAERYFQKSDELSRAAEGLDLESGTVKGMPRFAQYQTPGGKNYRELLLTLPIKSEAPVSFDNWVVKQPWYNTWVSEGSDFNKAKDVFNEWLKRENYGRGFTGFHFDEPNVLAHVRMNDRVDTEGNKVLFLEEIQSDWHQEGRKKGYKLDAKQEKHYRELADRFDDPQQRNPLTESEKEELKQLISIESSVPPAPFSKTWHELALKRMLRYAAENGYDKVAWTTGEMQAERYDLSKQIDSLEYIKNEDGTYEVTAHKEGTLLDMPSEWDHIKPEDLDKYVGKDVAQKIIGDKGKLDNKGYKELSGVDLKVGGEGMKGFYDKIIPDFLNKYGKKWGARVGETKIEGGATGFTKPYVMILVPSIDITPSMKTEVLTKGQVLYSGIPIPEMVRALKDLHNLGKKTEVYSKLVDISNQVYADGATSVKDFTAKMKSTLGDLWEQFKHLITELYNKAKAFNEQIGERGSISTKKLIRETTGQVKPSDMVREDVALTAGLAKAARAAQTAFRAGNKEGYAEARAKMVEMLNAKLNAQRNKFEIKIDKMKREYFLAKFKDIILARDMDRVKNDVVDYIKEKIPLKERGQFITMVKNSKTQRQLTSAFIRIDRVADEIAVKVAIRKLKDTVSKLSESKAVAIDYRNKIKDVIDEFELSGHSKKTMDKLKATQAYLDRAEAAGEEVYMPQRVLNKLKILGRVPQYIEDDYNLIKAKGYSPEKYLNLSQVEAIQKEIELFGQLGKTKLGSLQAIYEKGKQQRKNELLNTASLIKSTEKERVPVGEPITKIKKWIDKFIDARNYLLKTSVGLKPIDALAEATGMMPLKDALDLAYVNYLTSNDDIFTKLAELEDKLTEAQIKRVGVYAIAKQEGGVQRLTENNGIPIEEITAIKLTPDEQKYYEYIRSELDKIYPAIKKWARIEFDVDVGDVVNYVSFHTAFDEMNDLAMYDRFGKRPEEAYREMRTKTTEKGYIEKRKEASPNPLEVDIGKVFRRHMDDVQYSLHTSRDIKMYFEIVNSPEMREKLGDVGTLAWLEYLDLMARKGGVEGAKKIASLDTIRKNISVGILAGRLATALVQLNSFTDTAATIGTDYAIKGASSIATSKEWRNFIMDNFPEIKKAVGDDIAFRDFEDVYFKKLAKIGMTPLQILDGLMRSTAAAGAYQKLAIEKGIEVDLNKPDKNLIQEATKLMRFSQGSSFFKDQPLAITAGYGLTSNRSLNKTILTFQSFMLNRYANMKRQIWHQGIKEGNYKKAFMAFFWMTIMAAATEEGLRRTSAFIIDVITGDEGEPTEFEIAMLLDIIQSIPVVSQIVSSLVYSSNPIPVVNVMTSSIKGGHRLLYGKTGETQLKGLIETMGTVGTVAGVAGSSQAAQMLKKAVSDN